MLTFMSLGFQPYPYGPSHTVSWEVVVRENRGAASKDVFSPSPPHLPPFPPFFLIKKRAGRGGIFQQKLEWILVQTYKGVYGRRRK